MEWISERRDEQVTSTRNCHLMSKVDPPRIKMSLPWEIHSKVCWASPRALGWATSVSMDMVAPLSVALTVSAHRLVLWQKAAVLANNLRGSEGRPSYLHCRYCWWKHLSGKGQIEITHKLKTSKGASSLQNKSLLEKNHLFKYADSLTPFPQYPIQ